MDWRGSLAVLALSAYFFFGSLSVIRRHHRENSYKGRLYPAAGFARRAFPRRSRFIPGFLLAAFHIALAVFALGIASALAVLLPEGPFRERRFIGSLWAQVILTGANCIFMGICHHFFKLRKPK